MCFRRGICFAAGIFSAALSLVGPAHAQDPCAGYAWNVAHERALFAGAAQSVAAAASIAGAPELSIDRLYQLALQPQKSVHFARSPQGKKTPDKEPYAGLARVRIEKPGRYRVSLSAAFWADIVQGDREIASDDFAGAHACHAPRKIVLYQLPAGDLLLQLSGVADAHVEVLVTPAPP